MRFVFEVKNADMLSDKIKKDLSIAFLGFEIIINENTPCRVHLNVEEEDNKEQENNKTIETEYHCPHCKETVKPEELERWVANGKEQKK